MDRSQKGNLVASLKEMFSGSSLVVVTHQAGLTVKEVTDLRRQMRSAGATFKVTKNRLARLALEGTPFKGMASMFVGPTAVACSKDPVAAARVGATMVQNATRAVAPAGILRRRRTLKIGSRTVPTVSESGRPSIAEIASRTSSPRRTVICRTALATYCGSPPSSPSSIRASWMKAARPSTEAVALTTMIQSREDAAMSLSWAFSLPASSASLTNIRKLKPLAITVTTPRNANTSTSRVRKRGIGRWRAAWQARLGDSYAGARSSTGQPGAWREG